MAEIQRRIASKVEIEKQFTALLASTQQVHEVDFSGLVDVLEEANTQDSTDIQRIFLEKVRNIA